MKTLHHLLRISGLFFIGFFSFSCFAQTTYLQQGSLSYDFLERMEIKSGNTRNDIFMSVKSLRRDAIGDYLKTLDSSHMSKVDKYWLDYTNSDNEPYSDTANRYDSKHPILNSIYRSKANLFQVDNPDFHLYVNPVFDYEFGKERGEKQLPYRNSKGIEIRGDIDGKIGFYTYVTDNQALFPSYIWNIVKGTRAIPGEGYWKYLVDSNHHTADFFQARGYITFSPIKHIHVQFGNDRNFIGDGYRSLILSDYAKEYLFLKINTQIWRFNYQNLFTQFTDYTPTLPKPYPRKYGAFHTLSYDAAKWWNISLTEAIIFYDNLNNGRGYDINYLNPIIFYRSVEHYLGSPDNALAAMNNSFIIAHHFKIYQQLLFDELRVHELLNGSNWWGNKYSIQLGAKYIDVLGLKNVDWQVEFNYVRPYTYTSDTSGKNYAQFRQSLADPVGGNFEELINIVRINVFAPLDIRLKYFYIRQGHDQNGIDEGSNILEPYTWVEKYHPFDNTMLQGDLVTTSIAEAQVSYMIRHNLFLDVSYLYRLEKDEHTIFNKTNFINVGLRMNFIKQNYEY